MWGLKTQRTKQVLVVLGCECGCNYGQSVQVANNHLPVRLRNNSNFLVWSITSISAFETCVYCSAKAKASFSTSSVVDGQNFSIWKLMKVRFIWSGLFEPFIYRCCTLHWQHVFLAVDEDSVQDALTSSPGFRFCRVLAKDSSQHELIQRKGKLFLFFTQ